MSWRKLSQKHVASFIQMELEFKIMLRRQILFIFESLHSEMHDQDGRARMQAIYGLPIYSQQEYDYLGIFVTPL